MDNRRLGRRFNSSNRGRWAVGMAVALGIGTSCYYLWKAWQNEASEGTLQETVNNKEMSTGNTSRCVIVSKSVVDTVGIVPWEKLLVEEKDLVLIVLPDCKDNFKLDLDPQFSYKVIKCDTVLGVWACVKSLKKRELFVNIDDFPSDHKFIPKDIPNYVARIITWKNRDEILTSFPV